MKKPQVLIVDEYAGDYARHINQAGNGSIPIIACTSAAQAGAAYTGQTVVLGQPDMIAEVISDMPEVQWVQSTWAGVNALLDLEYKDYVLTGVKGVFGPPMSEYVLAYLLAHELKVLQRADHQVRCKWFNESSGSLNGKRAGIMGTGSIGAHIAGVLGSLGVHVSGLSRSGGAVKGFKQVSAVEQINSFLAELDYLIAVVPDTPATDELLNTTTLACLPEHAFFINIGRANVVEDTALIDALSNQRLAGAVLDVFRQEPLPLESPLWTTPHLLITAHVAADSRASDISPIFIENYDRFIHQRELNHIIDFARAY